MTPTYGYGGVAVELAKAIGLDPERTAKFVVVVEPDSLITVYVRQHLDEAAVRRVTDAIRVIPVTAVEVSEDCTVRIVEGD